MPIETLVKPAAFNLEKYSSSTESGLASVVISESGKNPKVS
jgi:hypothetical protein